MRLFLYIRSANDEFNPLAQPAIEEPAEAIASRVEIFVRHFLLLEELFKLRRITPLSYSNPIIFIN